MKNLIALLTDFGTSDHYVGVMKGVIKKIAPDAEFIDITHEIEPQNILHGAFVLSQSVKYFPDGTIFLAVADPGVGSNRRAIVAELGSYRFVAPDNGLITLAAYNPDKVYEISNTEIILPEKSSTFHGRDVFAPAAGHLANGTAISEFGSEIRPSEIVKLNFPEPTVTMDKIVGEVIYSDKFGNLITNIKTEIFDLRSENIAIRYGENFIKINKICKTFSDVEPGKIVAYVGSSGYLEIGIRNGNLSRKLKSV